MFRFLSFRFRCWSISTGKPLKIFNGHQGTVRCLAMSGDKLVSGSKDKAVKGEFGVKNNHVIYNNNVE